jgi:hypothetical protein
MAPMNPRLLRPTASGGFDPRRIANLAIWLEPTASTLAQNSDGSTPAVADGDPVGYWGDKSGTGRHVTQTDNNNRPTLKLNIRNGRPVLRFDGTNDGLKGTEGSSSVGIPYSLFVVYQSSDATASITVFSRISGSNTVEGLRKSAADTLQGIQQNGTASVTVTATAAGANWHIAELFMFGTASSLTYDVRVNGGAAVQMTTARTRDATALDRVLGIGFAYNLSPGTFAAEFLSGDIAEILCYSRALSTSERQTVERALGQKYGITVP